MLVSFSYKFIYIKTMKTAGTTTEAYFQPACMPPCSTVEHETPSQRSRFGIVGHRGVKPKDDEAWPEFNGHQKPSDIRATVGQEFWDGALKFANIRNPYTRALSAFFFKEPADSMIWTDKSSAIRQFREMVEQGRTSAHRHMLILDNMLVPDRVVRFEALERDIHQIAKQIGFKNTAPLAHYKKRNRCSYQVETSEFYDAARTEMIFERERWYFETFGYSPELNKAHDAPTPDLMA